MGGLQDLHDSTFDSQTTVTEPFKVVLPVIKVKARDPILPPKKIVIEEQKSTENAIDQPSKKEKKKSKAELDAEAAAEAARKELEQVKLEYAAKNSIDVAQLQSTRLLFSCLQFLQDG